jgi:hypothetical protein
VRFAVSPELELFAESVRGGVGGDLAALGWAELWSDPELLGPAVAGGLELGRAIAPLGLADGATLGAPLTVGQRARHASAGGRVAVPLAGGGLALAVVTDLADETALDEGTARVQLAHPEPLPDAAARWRAWSAATLAYLAGLADHSLDGAVAHARTREQFGGPLSALPAVQARLADAALACDGLALLAWGAASGEGPALSADLAWAASTCRAVTASAHQVHGAIGFALESGVHVAYRRAKTVQIWTEAVLGATE